MKYMNIILLQNSYITSIFIAKGYGYPLALTSILPPTYVPGPEPKPKLRGDARTFRVWLDPNQYQQDMTSSIQSGTEDPYETFNIIMRRKPKENNFKVWTIC